MCIRDRLKSGPHKGRLVIPMNEGPFGKWVISIILVTLIRWIEHLSSLGRVGETSELVEVVTERALLERAREKYEPYGDYVVVKFARWAFEKFPKAADKLGTQMRCV